MTMVYAFMLCQFLGGSPTPIECGQPGAQTYYFLSASDCEEHHRLVRLPDEEENFRKSGWRWVCLQKSVPGWQMVPGQ